MQHPLFQLITTPDRAIRLVCHGVDRWLYCRVDGKMSCFLFRASVRSHECYRCHNIDAFDVDL